MALSEPSFPPRLWALLTGALFFARSRTAPPKLDIRELIEILLFLSGNFIDILARLEEGSVSTILEMFMCDWRLGQVVVGPLDHQPMIVTHVAPEWVDCVWYEGHLVRQQSFQRSMLRHLALGHEDGDEASYCVDNFG